MDHVQPKFSLWWLGAVVADLDISPCLLRVISGCADHVDGLHRTQPVYLNKRTRAGPVGWGQPWARSRNPNAP
jgi:hypothetical protein